MTIFINEKFVLKAEKLNGFKSLWQRFLEFVDANPKVCKELKSSRLFVQEVGTLNKYIIMLECDSLAEYEKLNTKFSKNEELMKIDQEFVQMIIPETLFLEI